MLFSPPAAAASNASLAFWDISAVWWGLRGRGTVHPGGLREVPQLTAPAYILVHLPIQQIQALGGSTEWFS